MLLRELLARQNVDDLRTLAHEALNSGSIDDRWHHASPFGAPRCRWRGHHSAGQPSTSCSRGMTWSHATQYRSP
jgi:hypothetical protein